MLGETQVHFSAFRLHIYNGYPMGASVIIIIALKGSIQGIDIYYSLVLPLTNASHEEQVT